MNFSPDIPNITTIGGLAKMTLLLRDRYNLSSDRISDMSLIDFQRHLAVRKPETFLYPLIVNSPESAEAIDEAFQLYTSACWHESGFPAFDLSHSMAAAMALTDPSDVLGEDFKIPFQAFAIRLPSNFLFISGRDGKRQEAAYGLIHQMPVYQKGEGGTPEEHRILFRIIGRSSQIEGLTSLWEINILPDPNKPLREWISSEVPTQKNLSEAFTQKAVNDRPSMNAFRRIAINVCLYIAALGKGEKIERPKPKKSKRKIKEVAAPSPNVWILGKEVHLDSHTINAARSWCSAQTDAVEMERWKLQSQFTVRGHWRNQLHGPKNSLVKRIWIKPFTKGEGPTKIGHLYTMEEKA